MITREGGLHIWAYTLIFTTPIINELPNFATLNISTKHIVANYNKLSNKMNDIGTMINNSITFKGPAANALKHPCKGHMCRQLK